MTEQFSSPDLMLTFTFNNKWKEVNKFINDNFKNFTEKKSNFYLQFAPIDDMFFWKNRFDNIRSNWSW